MAGVASVADRYFGRYRLQELVAVSGMGVVYRAWDPKLECVVAIKLVSENMLADESARQQLLTEARIASSLNHPNICIIKDVEEADGQAGIVMEFVEGQVLTKIIPPLIGLPFYDVVRYGIEIAAAVAHAHDRNVIHRDLKSGNVIVTPDGRIKLLDFGLSKFQRRTEVPSFLATPGTTTSSHGIVGTPHYWAPEVLKRNPSDARSDIWSLGVLLYEMASGRMPFQGRTVIELGSAILREPPTPLSSHVPAALSKIIHHCLLKEIGERYQHASEIRAALETIQLSSDTRAGEKWKWLKFLKLRSSSGNAERLEQVTPRPTTIRSVAVLPLDNISGSPEQEYFVDGMTESLVTTLAKASGLRVISRTSIMKYKGVRKSIPQIARELSVDAIVEGSVVRVGDRVRITAELIEARTDQHIWAESYERNLRDVLALQAEVALAIAGEIRAKLNPAEVLLGKKPSKPELVQGGSSLSATWDLVGEVRKPATPVNPQAYDLYLRGRYYWNQRTEEGFRKAVEYFQQAIEIDPNSALFYAGLADCLILMGAGEYGLRAPTDIMPKAKLAALRALAIDETLAEAHASLATVKFRFERDWAGAETEFKRAIKLNQGYAVAHYWYGIYLIVLSRFDEALKEIKIAQQLDPHSAPIHHSLGFLLYLSCQHEEAMEQLRRTIAMDATFPLAHITLGLTLLRKGIFEEAIEEIRRAFTIAGVVPLWQGFLGQAYALAGKSEDALNILHQLVDLSKQRYVPPVAVAIVYAGLGKIDDAFQWLDKSLEERDGLLVYLKVGSVFDCLRSDRRFSELLSRTGLQDNPGLPVEYLSEERPEKGARDQAMREVEEKPAPKIKENQDDEKLNSTSIAVVTEQTAWSTAAKQQSTRLRPSAFLTRLAIGLMIAAVILFVAHYARKTLLPHRLMLAVLPFKNLSGGLEAQRLGDGLREELFTRLSELHPDVLAVIELASADGNLSGEQVCKRVTADYVLGGSVREAGDQVAITDQLLSCEDQTSIVGGRYEANVRDPVISTELMVAEDIVKQVLTMLPKDVHSEHQVSREAYEAYLTGRYLWNRRTTQSLTDAITYFNKAIQYDKTYAPAYAGLADCYSLLGSAPYTALSPTDAFPKAEVNARKAIELDASLAEAHVSLGYSELVYDWNYQAAEQEFRRALQLRPSYATAHQFYAYYLTAKERLDEAIVERKQAQQLEPTSPLLNSALGEAYYQARQFDLAIEQNRKSLVLDPNYGVALINLGRAYEQKGVYSQALEAFQTGLAAAPNDPALLAFLGHHYAVSGRKDQARGIIASLQRMSTNRYVPSLYIALVYTGLREKDQAFKWLDKAYEERCEYLLYLRSEPLADPLRNDPRFPIFLDRLGLRK